MARENQCINCNTIFRSFKVNKYCSNICYYRYNKDYLNQKKKLTPWYKKTYKNISTLKNCKVCNKEFVTGKFLPKQETCSKRCSMKWQDNRPERKIKKMEYRRKAYPRYLNRLKEWKKDRYFKYEPAPFRLEDDVEQLLLGSLLGDGSISLASKYACRYSEIHTKKQIEYSKYKASIFSKDFRVRFLEYVRNNKQEAHIRIGDKMMYHYYKLFYPHHKKIISNEILAMIKVPAIAIWHCDDGNFHHGEIRLATHCFGYEGNLLIRNWFKQKYDIDFTIVVTANYNKDGFNYSLRANKENSLKFINLVKDFVPDCMKYKIDIQREREKQTEYYLKNRKLKELSDKICRGCNNPFITKMVNKEYCTKLCCRKHHHILYRDRDLEYNRLYHKINREAILQRKREDYQREKNLILIETGGKQNGKET